MLSTLYVCKYRGVNYYPCFKVVLKSTDLARAWASGMLNNLCFGISDPDLAFYCKAAPDQYPDTAMTLKFDFTVFFLFVLDTYLSYLIREVKFALSRR
jgi:hypothetical protein